MFIAAFFTIAPNQRQTNVRQLELDWPIVGCAYNRMLFVNEKEQAMGTHNELDKSHKH